MDEWWYTRFDCVTEGCALDGACVVTLFISATLTGFWVSEVLVKELAVWRGGGIRIV
jgi:hypothetical protein